MTDCIGDHITYHLEYYTTDHIEGDIEYYMIDVIKA